MSYNVGLLYRRSFLKFLKSFKYFIWLVLKRFWYFHLACKRNERQSYLT